MADGAAVQFDDVWKKFRQGERHDSLRDLGPALIARLTRRRDPQALRDQEFWALREVSFEVKAGEALGIIGPNGAGKSTTLKLLTKIIRPTRGRFAVHGRVGALIEIAAGFHPDLTGRENVFLQGAIMGMRRDEIPRKLDEIVEFAGVGAFLDTPVKRYSSGMNARLGFAVAAHLQPDVLIIDEVLSVGDMAFQQRCVERMQHFKRQGVAIVFVSHNLQAVESLCDNALFLHREPRAYGPTSEVLQTYLRASMEAGGSSANEEVQILGAQLLDAAGEPAKAAVPGDLLTLEVRVHVRKPLPDLYVGLMCLRSTDLLVVYDGHFHDPEIGLSRVSEGHVVKLSCTFRAHLTRGHYHLACQVIHGPTQRILSRLAPAAMLVVEETRTYAGVVDLDVTVDRKDEGPLAPTLVPADGQVVRG